MDRYSHKQVSVSHPAGECQVDEGLAELLLALWEQGYDTEWSCQGGLLPGDVSEQTGYKPSMFSLTPSAEPSDAHIVFARFDKAVDFLRISIERLPRPKRVDDDPTWKLALQALLSYPEDNGVWRGNVAWAYYLTSPLTRVWAG